MRLLREPWRKAFFESYSAWVRDRGDVWRMRFSHMSDVPLMFDFGGYKGDWASLMRNRYNAQVHVFEPHPRFASALRSRFESDQSVTVHEFGLGDADRQIELCDAGDASSSFKSGGKESLQGKLRSTRAFFGEMQFPEIDVVKVNIEGGEYVLLPELINSDHIGAIKTLQVQFHLYEQEDISRRDAIRAQMARTHRCDWSYDFVWEQWSRKQVL